MENQVRSSVLYKTIVVIFSLEAIFSLFTLLKLFREEGSTVILVILLYLPLVILYAIGVLLLWKNRMRGLIYITIVYLLRLFTPFFFDFFVIDRSQNYHPFWPLNFFSVGLSINFFVNGLCLLFVVASIFYLRLYFHKRA